IDDGQRALRDDFEPAGPARVAEARSHSSFDSSGRFSRPRLLQPKYEQRDRDGRVVELECADQRRIEGTKFVISETEIKPLSRRRDGLAADPDLVADKQARYPAVSIIFDDVRPQALAILTIDDAAARGAGIALVGNNQLQRITKQFDMLVIDGCNAGHGRAGQPTRIVAAADTGLEHREFTFALLEVQAGQRKHGFEGGELFASTLRNIGE